MPSRSYLSAHSGPVFPVKSCIFVSVLYFPVFFLYPVFSCIFDIMGFSHVVFVVFKQIVFNINNQRFNFIVSMLPWKQRKPLIIYY